MALAFVVVVERDRSSDSFSVIQRSFSTRPVLRRMLRCVYCTETGIWYGEACVNIFNYVVRVEKTSILIIFKKTLWLALNCYA